MAIQSNCILRVTCLVFPLDITKWGHSMAPWIRQPAPELYIPDFFILAPHLTHLLMPQSWLAL